LESTATVLARFGQVAFGPVTDLALAVDLARCDPATTARVCDLAMEFALVPVAARIT
jgi:hypothetical protein